MLGSKLAHDVTHHVGTAIYRLTNCPRGIALRRRERGDNTS